MERERFVRFLLTAKRSTYAAKGAESAPSRPGSHDLRYSDGEMLYLDTYLGGGEFAGEEAVWLRGVPVWAMNYAGRVTGEGFSGDFLKAALMRGTEEAPCRGPARYAAGDDVYRMTVSGDLDWFSGEETIEHLGVPVYACRFHGGRIR